MADNYEDLADKISNVLEPGLAGYAYIRNALRWLDDHPDHAPGRTITESEIQEIAMNHESIRHLVGMLGITVVPDPEPTNAEKLAEALSHYAGLTSKTAKAVAEDMDREGWKAPGGDDD